MSRERIGLERGGRSDVGHRPGRSVALAVALVAAVSLLSLVPGAQARAEPFAGAWERASGAVRMVGPTGATARITIGALRLTGAAQSPDQAWLSVVIYLCDRGRCSSTTYTKALPPSSFSVDPTATSASLATTFAGLALRLTW